MVNRIISDFLGPFVVILEYTRTRTGLITIVFGLYLAMYVLGVYQLRTIKIKTNRLIAEKYADWIKTSPAASIERFYKYFYPFWEEMLGGIRILYVLNKHDLWPVRKTPENVLKKIKLEEGYIEERIKSITGTGD